jgi:hypothetical protein
MTEWLPMLFSLAPVTVREKLAEGISGDPANQFYKRRCSMRGRGLAVLVKIVMVFLLVHSAEAGLTSVVFNAWTTNFPDSSNPNDPRPQMNFAIWPYDNHNYRGPDFVGEIIVTAPDGSIFQVHPSIDWLQYDQVYWKVLYPENFKKGKILGGTYKVTVVSLEGFEITVSNTVSGAMLPVAAGIVWDSVTEPVTLKWDAVAGADHYRIHLWDNWVNEPVYWTWNKQARTNFTSFEIPIGELKPNRNYRFRVEARSGILDLDKRSRSAWFSFTTGSWQ